MSYTPPKRDFLGKPAPLGYIAGLGRGAIGFTTRSDLGSGVSLEEGKSIPAAQVQLAKEQLRQESQLSFLKEEEGLFSSFSSTAIDKEDQEADDFFEALDKRMSSRRKKRQEVKIVKNEENLFNFAAEKAALASVDWDAWNSIPDGGDHLTKLAQTKRQKKIDPHSRGERYSAVPDSFLQAGLSGSAHSNGMMSRLDALIRETENHQNDSHIIKDPILIKPLISSTKEKEMKSLLKAAVRTNPLSEDAWLSAIKFDRQRGKLKEAKRLISEALLRLPDLPILWLEAVDITLQTDGHIDALMILKDGLKRIPNSPELFLRLSEMDPENKRQTLQSSLSHNPSSTILWKEYLKSVKEGNTTSSESSLLPILDAALQRCPNEGDLWIEKARILSNLSLLKEAQDTLNLARTKCPQSVEIWLEAFRLEETHFYSSSSNIEDLLLKMASKAIQSLPRETNWLQEAKLCLPLTSKMIIKALLKENIIHPSNLLALSRENNLSSPTLQSHLLLEYLSSNINDEAIYLETISLLIRNNHSMQEIDSLFSKAFENCSEIFEIWRLLIKFRKEKLKSALSLFSGEKAIILLNDFSSSNTQFDEEFYYILKQFLRENVSSFILYDYIFLRFIRDTYYHFSHSSSDLQEALRGVDDISMREGGIISLLKYRFLNIPITIPSVPLSIPTTIVMSFSLPNIGASRALLESLAKNCNNSTKKKFLIGKRMFWSPSVSDLYLFSDSFGMEREIVELKVILTLFRLLLERDLMGFGRGLYSSLFTSLLEENCKNDSFGDIFIYERIFLDSSSPLSKGKANLLKGSSPLYHVALGRITGDKDEFRNAFDLIKGRDLIHIDTISYYFLANNCPEEVDVFLARKSLYFIGGLKWASFLKSFNDCDNGTNNDIKDNKDLLLRYINYEG